MGTITKFVDGQVVQERQNGLLGVKSNVIDFSDTNVVAGDVVQGLKIGLGQTVMNVGIRIITAEGATCTVTVGDGDDADDWDASCDLNASAAVIYLGLPGTDTYATAGKYYAAADTIDLTMGHDTDTAVIEVYAFYFTNTKQTT